MELMIDDRRLMIRIHQTRNAGQHQTAAAGREQSPLALSQSLLAALPLTTSG
jgi:hypothetical protein